MNDLMNDLWLGVISKHVDKTAALTDYLLDDYVMIHDKLKNSVILNCRQSPPKNPSVFHRDKDFNGGKNLNFAVFIAQTGDLILGGWWGIFGCEILEDLPPFDRGTCSTERPLRPASTRDDKSAASSASMTPRPSDSETVTWATVGHKVDRRVPLTNSAHPKHLGEFSLWKNKFGRKFLSLPTDIHVHLIIYLASFQRELPSLFIGLKHEWLILRGNTTTTEQISFFRTVNRSKSVARPLRFEHSNCGIRFGRQLPWPVL